MPLAPQVPNTPEDVTKFATITSRAATGTQVRYFIDADPGFVAGDVVAISGFASDPSSNAYNGTYTIVSVGSNPPSFLVNSTANGPIILTTDFPQVVSLGSNGDDYEYSDVDPVYTIDSEDLVANNPIASATQPTGRFDGQLWFDTANGNKLYRYNATTGQWVNVQDAAIATASAAAAAAEAAAASAANGAAAAQATADGKNKIFRQSTTPTATAVNDQWIDTGNGNILKSWNGTAWVSVQDTAIAAASAAATAAQAAATAAQTSADGKNRVFRQSTTPTATAVGDIWFNTGSDNAISRWDGSSWVATSLGNNALSSLSASKLTAGTIDASVITVSNINAGNISTGTLNSARIASASITGTQIAAGTITASNIAVGTITASNIASGTITATQIAAGTITGATIAANTITGSNIQAGTITASNIAAGTITATQISSGYVYAGTIAASQVTAGTLSASVAITAQSGTIGGWNISSTSIYTGSIASPNQFLSSSGGALFTGTVSTENLGVAGSATIGTLNVGGAMFAPNLTTSTSAVNLRVTTGSVGEVQETSASSIRFKENIVDLADVAELDPKKLLTLPVRAFTYKADYLSASDDRFGVLLPGFIAEEVDELYPIAADYGQDGPHSWNERFLIPGMLALIQDLYKEIEQLKEDA